LTAFMAREHYNLVNALAKPTRTRILFRRSHYYYGFRFQRTIPANPGKPANSRRYPANILRVSYWGVHPASAGTDS